MFIRQEKHFLPELVIIDYAAGTEKKGIRTKIGKRFVLINIVDIDKIVIFTKERRFTSCLYTSRGVAVGQLGKLPNSSTSALS
jgi:hypothetical protein